MISIFSRSVLSLPRRRSAGSSFTTPVAQRAWRMWALSAGVLLSGHMFAQAPVPIPTTATLLAGGATAAGTGTSGVVLPANGSPCYAGSPNTATDAYGDGCPGPYTQFSADFRGGVVADGAGNVYVIENTQNLLRKIDARSGVVTVAAGGASAVCAGASDKYGDSCPLASTILSGPRGGWADPYGNIILAGYNMQTVNVVCNAVSPLCPNTAGRKQVGFMYRIAGCVASATVGGTAAVGTTNGTAGDGGIASPNGNLAGDIADWGGGNTGYTTTCSSTVGGVSAARGAAADKYGNVYIADTTNLRWRVVVGPPTFTLPNGTVLTNPLANLIKLDPAYAGITPATAYGHIYPILGGFTAAGNGGTAIPTAAGTACAGGSGGTTLDTIGDGCPFYESTNGSSTSSTLSAGVDADGNAIFLDQSNKVVQVLYVAGTTMQNAIRAANGNPALTVNPGSIYPLIGLGGNSTNAGISFTPTLGTATAINSNGSRVALGPGGNLYFSDYGKNSVYMLDINTGYARNVLVSGTPCATAAPDHDAVGDGCSATVFGATPATPFIFGGASDTIGITFNPEGDLIVGDITDQLIRRVTSTGLSPVQVGTGNAQTITLHGAAGTTGMTAALMNPSADIGVGAVACAAAANADGTLDCQVPVTFAPLTPGQRSAVLSVTAGGVNGTATFAVAGLATGSALVTDSASPVVNTTGSVTSAQSVAVDGSHDLFTMDTGAGKFTEVTAAGTTMQLPGTLPAAPYQIAVDNLGDVYATGTGSATITRLTPTAAGGYTASTLSYLPPVTPAAPYGIVTDRQGNVYVSDQANQAVYEIAAGTPFEMLNPLITLATGFTAVGELAIDGSGNLFVADPGAGSVKRILAGTNTLSTIVSGIHPTHIAADTAGDLYIQDATAATITEVPLSGASPTAVYATTSAPTGIAVDSSGALYDAESALPSIKIIQRNAATYSFGTSTAGSFSGTLTNTGNLTAAGYNQTDSSDFQVVGSGTNACNLASTAAVGAACGVTGTFTPQAGSGNVADVVTYLPAASTTGSLTLSGIKNGSAITTSTTISGETPSAPVYVASGTEVTFTVTVASSAGTASGSVAVTIDSNAPVTYNLNSSGQAAVALSGLASGNHTISAIYASQNGFTGSSTSAATAFNIAQAITTLTWAPSATTQQFSAAVGTGVLDATAASGGVAVPGSVIYTATPATGTAAPIQSASYLAIGTYTLGATFVPNDAVDFSGATGTVSNYTVTKASTSAAVGATQMLVASDGTGNYTTVQSAVNALSPTAGGSVYIKPGTYNGFVTVVTPNVALRGLGGDPTQVVISNAAGAFGSSYPYTGEFTAADSNNSQNPGSTVFTGDEGSATIVIAKGAIASVNGGATTTPNNFYGENLTFANTYDTASTTTTTYEPTANGTCTVNAGPAMTYAALYNSGQLCASQALAIWITSDLAVMNNVYTTSQQDTIYAGSQGVGSNGYVPSRQYWFRGKVTGDVDYIFGDAAAVFDSSSIYTTYHGTVTGSETIEAQNKAKQTGGAGDYLSGYIMNNDVFTSQSSGMTNLYFGRPYGTYSTYIMLNSYVDQVNPLGYLEFSGDSNLPTSTYAEYNDILYTDPATGSPDPNGIAYLGTGGSSGAGVTGARETTSTDPGTSEAANTVKTTLTQAQAQQYFPTNFLSTTVPSTISSTANWNPTAALAANVNAFVPAGTTATVAPNSSVTILMRPQTPGLGAVTNGVYTVPTGTYSLTDTYNGATTTLATGSLDASGEAYYTTSTLNAGTHSLSWTYSGDSNFSGSTTASAYSLIVSGTATTTALSVATNPITYGQPASVTATVSAAAQTPSGTVTLTVDGATTQTMTLTGGSATFTLTGLLAGSHTLSANYAGSATFTNSSTTANTLLTVNPAVLTVSSSCVNRFFGQANSCTTTVTGYQYSDSAATVFTGTPAANPPARTAVSGSYTVTPLASSLALTALGSANYTLNVSSTTLTISGGAAQQILFAPLPNFPHGSSYQLTAHATSGLPVTYTVTAGAGAASVSGSTLTVTGTGTVTIQASQATDPTGDYAAAAPVSRSFTAQ